MHCANAQQLILPLFLSLFLQKGEYFLQCILFTTKPKQWEECRKLENYLYLPSSIPSFHPSCHLSVIPSFHHSIFLSFHHSIIPSFHHSIIPSFHHSIIPSFHHSIIP